MIIPRNDMHLVLGAHLSSPEHVKCTFVLIINRIVGIVAIFVYEHVLSSYFCDNRYLSFDR